MNRSYNASGAPGFSAVGASIQIREEFESIGAGFADIEKEIDEKVFAATAPSEWVNPVRAETYVSATQFRWSGADATGIMTPHRRVRCTVNGAYVYSEVMSSVYASGVTTVNLYDPILTNQLTLVEFGVISPFDQASSSMSLAHLMEIIDGRIALITPTVEYSDLGGSGEKFKLGGRYMDTDDNGAKIFALETIPV